MRLLTSLLCAATLLACGGSPPQLGALPPPQPNVVPAEQVTNLVVAVSVTDEDADLTTLLAALVTPDGTTTQTEVDVTAQVNNARNATISLQLTVAPQKPGNYIVRITAIDEAGNESAPQETSFAAEPPAPPPAE